MTTYVINDVKVTDDTAIEYADNPKRAGGKAHGRYDAYQHASTIKEYFELMADYDDGAFKRGTMMADLRYDLQKGFLTINEDEE